MSAVNPPERIIAVYREANVIISFSVLFLPE
jgi:hypothetical protein